MKRKYEMSVLLALSVAFGSCGGRGALGPSAAAGFNDGDTSYRQATLESIGDRKVESTPQAEVDIVRRTIAELERKKVEKGRTAQEISALDEEIAGLNARLEEAVGKIKERDKKPKDKTEDIDPALITYELQYKHSLKCLEVEGASTENGARVQQFTCNKSNVQKFRLIQKDGAFLIENFVTGRCLAPLNASLLNGTPIVQAPCAEEAPHQLFKLESDGAGFVFMINVASNRCVDISGISLSDRAGAQLFDCLNGDAQRLKMTQVNAKPAVESRRP